MKKIVFTAAVGATCGLLIGIFGTLVVEKKIIHAKSVATLWRGWESLAANDYGEAIAMFNRSLALNADWYQPHLGLAQTYERLGQWEIALGEYHLAADLLDPKDKLEQLDKAKIFSRIGNIYLQHDKYEDAVRSFQQGVKVFPEWPDFYSGLATAYNKSGDREKTKQSLREYLRYEIRKNRNADRMAAEKRLKELEKP